MTDKPPRDTAAGLFPARADLNPPITMANAQPNVADSGTVSTSAITNLEVSSFPNKDTKHMSHLAPSGRDGRVQAATDIENLSEEFADVKIREITDVLSVSHNAAVGSDRPPTTFKYFPELPLEMRLMVWRRTFPCGRKVHLGFEKIPRLIDLNQGYGCPVSMHINQESRVETLKHYCLVLSEDHYLTSNTSPGLIFCINPRIDDLFITLHDCFLILWWNVLDSKQPGFLSSITSLEIHLERWFDFGIMLSFQLDGRELLMLPRLKSFRIYAPEQRGCSEAWILSRKRGLEDFLDQNKTCFESGICPKVTVSLPPTRTN